MRIIGITGGIGSGKTTLLERIAITHNCIVISADTVARDLCEPGGPCHRPLIDLLGQSILADDGRLKRHAIAEIIFTDKELLDRVNRLIHPAVEAYIKAGIIAAEAGGPDFFFIEAALLIEGGYGKIVDELWYIHADEDVRIGRIGRERGYTVEKARAIIESQLTDDEFRAACDVVIDNNGDIESALEQIEGFSKEQ